MDSSGYLFFLFLLVILNDIKSQSGNLSSSHLIFEPFWASVSYTKNFLEKVNLLGYFVPFSWPSSAPACIIISHGAARSPLLIICVNLFVHLSVHRLWLVEFYQLVSYYEADIAWFTSVRVYSNDWLMGLYSFHRF